MKNILNLKYGIILAFIMILTFLPIQYTYADNSKTYFVSQYNINANIKNDGSADIEEFITYDFSGQFNGILRDIDFSSTDGIKNQKVFVIKDGHQKEFSLNASDSLDYSGAQDTYNFIKEGQLARLKIFEQSISEKKTFVIKYTLQNVVAKYNDIAEFNRKVIDSNWQTRLENIDIKITLPEGASKEEIKVFAHGPLTGESKIIDARNIEFTVPEVQPGTFIETLVIFPPKLVPQSKNIINENTLPNIMENEKKLADEANKVREEARDQVEQEQQKTPKNEQQDLQQYEKQLSKNVARKNAGIAIVMILFLLWFFLIIYIYLKYDKEYKHSFQGKYIRELPGEYTPAEMSILMSFGSVNTRDLMATLMDLVRKKQLLLNSGKVNKRSLFGTKEITQYTISINKNSQVINLKKHEQFLISWFISNIGNGDSVTLDEIKDYVKSRSCALQFKKDYDNWCMLVKEEAAKNDFFDTTCKKGSIIGSVLGLGYLAAGFAVAALLNTPAAVVTLLQGAVLLIFSARIKRRSQYGNEQHAMWLAFKSFLKDFSRLDKAIIPSIVIWEHYLVYAISLGVAKEVIRQLPVVFRDDELDNNNLTFMYGVEYGYFAGFSAMFDNTLQSVEGAVSSASSIANSSDSSSSGFGGGFSGGSSDGGGGGGAF